MSIPTNSDVSEDPGAATFVNFNQDCTSLSVGHRNGYQILNLTSLDSTANHVEVTHSSAGEEVCIVERLFSSSLVAIVSLAAPRKLRVCHFKRGTEICTYSYSNTILAVKLNRGRLLVCLEESLYIHNIRDMKVVHTIRDTPPNPHGLCALTINSAQSYVAYPGSSTIGELQIFDAINLKALTMIPAHDSPLAAIIFHPTGEQVATASEKGTVIRVFSVTEGTRLYEFRRGVKRCVSISSLRFSHCGNYLCCSSNTETVHVFKLEEPKNVPNPVVEDAGWYDYLTKAVSAGATYLPTQVMDVFTQGRAFAVAYLPVANVKNVLAIAPIQRALRLLVASTDGNLYVYNLENVEPAGDLTLLKVCRIIPSINDGETLQPTENSAVPMSDPLHDSEKLHEMAAAVDLPTQGGFRFDDEEEFPPVSHTCE